MNVFVRMLCGLGIGLWIIGGWFSAGCSARECRIDIDCAGNDLCLSGKCAPYGQSGGDASTSPNLCNTGESRICYRGPQGSQTVGICKAGKQTCLGDRWSVCEGEILPIAESCNGEDNDCNGAIDDGKFGGGPCLVPGQKGPCERGIEACVSGKLICKQLVQSNVEVCGDGTDNNCNGEIDESPPCTCKPGTTQACYTGPSASRTKGNCQDGVQTCTPDQKWSECKGSIVPQQEVCDGKDNDCNGQTDEGLQRTCESTCGTGTEVCTGGQWQTCKAPTPSKEVCDGKDNDCNGQTDENLTQNCTSSCGPGTQKCVSGQWATCEGPTPTTEICDGKDNDCNGKTDDGLTRPCSTSCGSGTQSCVNGKWEGCNGTTPTTETCDNKDNDCNGKIDDNVRRPCSNQCGTGTEICVRGRWYACTAPRPSTEICDGKDNDCNGKTDEASGPPKRISTDLTQTYFSLAAVWSGSYFGTLYGYKSSVYFQRWTKDGLAIGSPKLIKASAFPLSTQLLWTGKEFVALWYIYKQTGHDIYFARISIFGSLLSVKQLTHIKGANSSARMAWNGTNFGLVWTDGAPSKRVVRFGRLDSSGNAVGTTVAVTDINGNAAYLPDVATLKGSFGVTWYERRNNVQDIYFQQYSSTGSKSGVEANISKTPTTSYFPRISASSQSYLVAYYDSPSGTAQIYARRVYSTGLASTTLRHVSKNVKSPISLDLKPLGGTSTSFASAWGDLRKSPRQVYFARLSFSGLNSRGETQISQSTSSVSYPAVAPISDKLVGIFWIDTSTGRGQIYFKVMCGF